MFAVPMLVGNIAQAVSALLCLLRLMKLKELFDLKFSYMKLQKKYNKKIIRLGLTSGISGRKAV